MNRQQSYEYYLKVKDDRDVLLQSWYAIELKYIEAIAKGESYNVRKYYRRLSDDLWFTFADYDDVCWRLWRDYHLC